MYSQLGYTQNENIEGVFDAVLFTVWNARFYWDRVKVFCYICLANVEALISLFQHSQTFRFKVDPIVKTTEVEK